MISSPPNASCRADRREARASKSSSREGRGDAEATEAELTEAEVTEAEVTEAETEGEAEIDGEGIETAAVASEDGNGCEDGRSRNVRAWIRESREMDLKNIGMNSRREQMKLYSVHMSSSAEFSIMSRVKMPTTYTKRDCRATRN